MYDRDERRILGAFFGVWLLFIFLYAAAIATGIYLAIKHFG